MKEEEIILMAKDITKRKLIKDRIDQLNERKAEPKTKVEKIAFKALKKYKVDVCLPCLKD